MPAGTTTMNRFHLALARSPVAVVGQSSPAPRMGTPSPVIKRMVLFCCPVCGDITAMSMIEHAGVRDDADHVALLVMES